MNDVDLIKTLISKIVGPSSQSRFPNHQMNEMQRGGDDELA